MLNVVLDTNIIVLARMDDPAFTIVALALEGSRLKLCYSPQIIAEYAAVLSDPDLQKDPQDVQEFLTLVHQKGQEFHPTFTLDVCSHAPDNRFVECAVEAKADFVVTVNTEHFPKEYQEISVVPPSVFLDVFRSVF